MTTWHIYRDGTHTAGPFDSYWDAVGDLHRRQPQSVEWATTHEGWEIREEEQPEPDGEEEPYCATHDLFNCPFAHGMSRSPRRVP